LSADDPVRQQLLVAIVESLPDELALDPSMYPAAMRENIEFYRRVRRSYNQEATGAALGEPLPPRNGRPRAPKEPWDPFKEEGAEPVERPEQFNMPPSRGRLSAAENLLAKTKGKLGKLAADVIKITDKIALLEEKYVKLQEQVRKYDVIDAHLQGMNEKAIAKKYRIPVAEVRTIIAKSPVAKQAAKLAETGARLAELQAVIGKKRAALPEGAMDAELAVLQQELAKAEAAALSARQAVEAAKNINDIARQAEESAINNLTEAMYLSLIHI
jgi:transposase